MHFPAAEKSNAVIAVTVIATLILFAVTIQLAFAGVRTGLRPLKCFYFGSAVLMLILNIASAGMYVRGYDLDNSTLIVKFGVSKKVFLLKDLSDVKSEPDPFRGAIRVFANGGWWSYLGKFSSPSRGEFSVYLTDPRKAIFLRFANEEIAISPRDTEKFIQTAREHQ